MTAFVSSNCVVACLRAVSGAMPTRIKGTVGDDAQVGQEEEEQEWAAVGGERTQGQDANETEGIPKNGSGKWKEKAKINAVREDFHAWLHYILPDTMRNSCVSLLGVFLGFL